MGERKIYILLSDTGTIFTRIIKLYTKNHFNHASIAFDAELRTLYSFGRKNTKNPFIGGFVKENINEGLLKKASGIIYSLTVTEEELNKMLTYIQKIESQKYLYKYNLIGLIGVMFNKSFERKYGFFCSQFVASVMNETNHINFEKPLSQVTPQDLTKLNNLDFIYKGQLGNYSNSSLQLNTEPCFSPSIAV